MKKVLFFTIIGAILLAAPSAAFSKEPVPIDVLYLNHGPMQPVLRDLRALFPKYGAKIRVAWYDFESKAGERFKEKKGIHRHTPLTIWVDGRTELESNGRTLRFEGFPSGSGPALFQGKWAVSDLAAVLDQLTAKN